MSLQVIRNWVVAIVIVASAGGVLMATAMPQVASAAKNCTENFLGFPAWYRDLTDNNCDIKSPTSDKEGLGLSKFIWHIGFNVLEIALVAVGYISAFFTLYGGFLFITSSGKPEGAAKARLTMLNAIIGLLISLAAIGVVEFVIRGVIG